jgi:hypothetical protein
MGRASEDPERVQYQNGRAHPHLTLIKYLLPRGTATEIRGAQVHVHNKCGTCTNNLGCEHVEVQTGGIEALGGGIARVSGRGGFNALSCVVLATVTESLRSQARARRLYLDLKEGWLATGQPTALESEDSVLITGHYQ